MNVPDGLPGVFVAICNHSITAFGYAAFGCYVIGNYHYVAHKRRIIAIGHIGNARYMLFRDNQNVNRGLRVQIVERGDGIVFIDERSDLFICDFAEYAIRQLLAPFEKGVGREITPHYL
jgi:hypothetical protein